MFQIRIHGRGGQGVVTAAEILSVAAFVEVTTPKRSRASAPSAWAPQSCRSAASTAVRSEPASR